MYIHCNGTWTARGGRKIGNPCPNQRTKATLADGSYWVYSYDDLGQVTGVRAGAGPAGEDVISQQTGKRFVPADPESFTYDADGNM